MVRKKTRWMPPIGSIATYIGRSSSLARGGYNVRVVAETCADRMVVEAIGRSGAPVRFTVKRENLHRSSQDCSTNRYTAFVASFRVLWLARSVASRRFSAGFSCLIRYSAIDALERSG